MGKPFKVLTIELCDNLADPISRAEFVNTAIFSRGDTWGSLSFRMFLEALNRSLVDWGASFPGAHVADNFESPVLL